MLSKGGGGRGPRGFRQDTTRLLAAAGDLPRKRSSSRHKGHISPFGPCSWRVPTPSPSPSQKRPRLILQLPWELNEGKRTVTEVQEIQIPYKGLSEGKVWHRFGGQVAQSSVDISLRGRRARPRKPARPRALAWLFCASAPQSWASSSTSQCVYFLHRKSEVTVASKMFG